MGEDYNCSFQVTELLICFGLCAPFMISIVNYRLAQSAPVGNYSEVVMDTLRRLATAIKWRVCVLGFHIDSPLI